MANFAPLVISAGKKQRLQSGDTIQIDKLNIGPIVDVTISGGNITLPANSSFLRVDTEGAAGTDQLDEILSEVSDGNIVVLIAANAGRTVTVADGGGANRFMLPGAFNLGVNSPLMVNSQISFWFQMMRSTN